MTPRHHPSETLIAACAAGSLRPGASLVVRTHLARCTACASQARFFEGLAGAMLDTEPPAQMSSDALARALAAIDRPAAPARAKPAPRPVAGPAAGPEGVRFGRRRWMAPGAWVTHAKTDRRSRELVYLLRIGPGMVLPRHSHTGCEFTCVLEGSFADSAGRYEVGDFVATDESVEHSPVVAGDGACTCLVSTDAPLVMRGLIGRMFQPLAGI